MPAGEGGTPTTNAGRSRKRGSSTNGNGTQTTSPGVKAASVAIESLAIRSAGPFAERIKIADKGIARAASTAEDHAIALYFPDDRITRPEPECETHGARDRRLYLRSDASEDHAKIVRNILTGSKSYTRIGISTYSAGL